MLIALIDDQTGATYPITLAAFGSCRTYNTLGAAIGANRIPILHFEFAPTIYSAGDAWQYLEFCLGVRQIPDWARQLVFSDTRTANPSPQMRADLLKADVCVVEISSFDQIVADGYFFNWNAVGMRFVRGNGAAYSKWWHEVTDRAARQASPETVEYLLQTMAANGEEATAPLRRFLTALHYEILDQFSLRDHLVRLKNTLQHCKKWVIVSHFNTALDGPDMLPERQILIETIKQVAKSLGFIVFDPTSSVVNYGYRNALKGNGNDKHHYVAEFEPIVGADLLHCILGALAK